jgi:hypothetical protein
MSTITKYLSGIGRKGGQAGTGEAKRRGDSAYYRAMRAKKSKPCPRCRGTIGRDMDGAPCWSPKPGTMAVPCDECSARLR